MSDAINRRYIPWAGCHYIFIQEWPFSTCRHFNEGEITHRSPLGRTCGSHQSIGDVSKRLYLQVTVSSLFWSVFPQQSCVHSNFLFFFFLFLLKNWQASLRYCATGLVYRVNVSLESLASWTWGVEKWTWSVLKNQALHWQTAALSNNCCTSLGLEWEFWKLEAVTAYSSKCCCVCFAAIWLASLTNSPSVHSVSPSRHTHSNSLCVEMWFLMCAGACKNKSNELVLFTFGQ